MRVCIIIILILILGFANAAKITVGPMDANYSVIQQAVENASTGDIIEVQSGTYHENVYLSHSVTLLGVDTGKGLPVVNASRSGSAITVLSNGTTVSGFNLTGSGHCGCGNAGVMVESYNNTSAITLFSRISTAYMSGPERRITHFCQMIFWRTRY